MQPPHGSATKRLSLFLMVSYQGLPTFKYSLCNLLRNVPLRVKSCSLRSFTSHTISCLYLSVTSPTGQINCLSLVTMQPMSCNNTPVLSNTLIQWAPGLQTNNLSWWLVVHAGYFSQLGATKNSDKAFLAGERILTSVSYFSVMIKWPSLAMERGVEWMLIIDLRDKLTFFTEKTKLMALSTC